VATSSLVKSIVPICHIEFVFAGVVFWGSKYVPQVDGHNGWNSASCMQLILQSQESYKMSHRLWDPYIDQSWGVILWQYNATCRIDEIFDGNHEFLVCKGAAAT
jgi:hypothetical protein